MQRTQQQQQQQPPSSSSGNPHHSLLTILGTEKGIAALAEFITKSGAFTKTGELRAHEQSAEQAEGIGPDAQDDEGGDPDRVGEVEHSDNDEDAR